MKTIVSVLIFFMFNVACADACRIRRIYSIDGKSNSAVYAFFDNVVAVQAVDLLDKNSSINNNNLEKEFVKLKLIKSYKGEMPGLFLVRQGSSAACGQEFRKGKIYLAFFDAAGATIDLPDNENLPYFESTLAMFTNSKLVEVADQAEADQIISKARISMP